MDTWKHNNRREYDINKVIYESNIIDIGQLKHISKYRRYVEDIQHGCQQNQLCFNRIRPLLWLL